MMRPPQGPDIPDRSWGTTGQPYSGQPPTEQDRPGLPQPGQPQPGQFYPGQPYAVQPYPGQPSPGQGNQGQGYPGQGYPGQGYPGHGHPGGFGPPAGRPRRRHAGVVVLVLGLILTAVVGGVRGVVVYHNRHPHHYGATAVPSGSGPGQLDANSENSIAEQISYDLQIKDEKAFLSHMSGAGLTAARAWWTNMATIGFDYGAMNVADGTSPPADDTHPVTFTAQIGIHSPLGPVERSSNGASTQDYVPTTSYSITLSPQPGNVGTPLITGWRGMSNAPWDLHPLYAVHEKNVTVVGDTTEASFVRTQASLAQHSAAWIRSFLGVYPNQVQQSGFVAFVSASPRTRATWFSSSSKPRGWQADPSSVAGFFKPLPESTASDPGVYTSAAGGGYVVLGTKEPTRVDEEATDVHEFAHDLMSINDLWSFGTSKPLPAWVVEGWARYVETYFYASPNNPAPTSAISAKPHLAPVLTRSAHPRFTGSPPSDNAIYGQAALANYYYDESASVYEYLSVTYGDKVGFGSVLIAYLGSSDGPFAAVLDHSSHGTDYYKNPSTVQAGWQRWYLKNYGR